MNRGIHAVIATVLILASNAGDGGCANVTPWACDEDTRGIRVVNGEVTDVIVVTCDPPPRTHTLRAWIDYRPPGGAWGRAGNEEVSHKKPEPRLELPIGAWDCKPGQYRASWEVSGTSGNQAETLFSRTGHDFWGTEVSAEDCVGS